MPWLRHGHWFWAKARGHKCWLHIRPRSFFRFFGCRFLNDCYADPNDFHCSAELSQLRSFYLFALCHVTSGLGGALLLQEWDSKLTIRNRRAAATMAARVSGKARTIERLRGFGLNNCCSGHVTENCRVSPAAQPVTWLEDFLCFSCRRRWLDSDSWR